MKELLGNIRIDDGVSCIIKGIKITVKIIGFVHNSILGFQGKSTFHLMNVNIPDRKCNKNISEY